jgi:hypothetical protein
MGAIISVAAIRQLSTLSGRYGAYREAVLLLGSDGTTVAARKAAIGIREEFEAEVRRGILDDIFGWKPEHVA